ncbi:MAG: prepilin-type N-terminal cleavage/methylation domain-containing protein [Candidatus Omnitrophota bacterium]
MIEKKGFTLLEVLLAVVFLAAGSIFLLQAIGSGLFAGNINETEIVAINLAQEKMEFVRNTAYASIASEARADVSGFPAYQREVVVTDATLQHNIKKVVVKVYYTIKNTELNKSLTTYVAI